MSALADLGTTAMHFQGGVILLAGHGCLGCGHGFWTEDDPARHVDRTELVCPRCARAVVAGGVEVANGFLAEHDEDHLKQLRADLAYAGGDDVLLEWRGQAWEILDTPQEERDATH